MAMASIKINLHFNGETRRLERLVKLIFLPIILF